MKRKILPFANIGEEKNRLVTNSDGHTKASHIYDSLDAEFERDNSDAEGEESEIIQGPQTNFDVNEDYHVEKNDQGDTEAVFRKFCSETPQTIFWFLLDIFLFSILRIN